MEQNDTKHLFRILNEINANTKINRKQFLAEKSLKISILFILLLCSFRVH